MFEVKNDSYESDSGSLLVQAAALLSGCRDRVANAANLSAFLFYTMENVNWVGFYFLQDGQLLVGPFQGKPACVSIPLGQGVCGKAAQSRKVLRVADVHAFAGHIACDADSQSEIVLPLVSEGKLIGVLDIDSPVTNRFDETDESFLTGIAEIYIASLT
jgi:GAF domain-containing protein